MGVEKCTVLIPCIDAADGDELPLQEKCVELLSSSHNRDHPGILNIVIVEGLGGEKETRTAALVNIHDIETACMVQKEVEA